MPEKRDRCVKYVFCIAFCWENVNILVNEHETKKYLQRWEDALQVFFCNRKEQHMKTTLIIMAAGIGSRFGTGIKQLAKMSDNGEIIMDYSIYDAKEAGFDKVVL